MPQGTDEGQVEFTSEPWSQLAERPINIQKIEVPFDTQPKRGMSIFYQAGQAPIGHTIVRNTYKSEDHFQAVLEKDEPLKIEEYIKQMTKKIREVSNQSLLARDSKHRKRPLEEVKADLSHVFQDSVLKNLNPVYLKMSELVMGSFLKKPHPQLLQRGQHQRKEIKNCHHKGIFNYSDANHEVRNIAKKALRSEHKQQQAIFKNKDANKHAFVTLCSSPKPSLQYACDEKEEPGEEIEIYQKPVTSRMIDMDDFVTNKQLSKHVDKDTLFDKMIQLKQNQPQRSTKKIEQAVKPSQALKQTEHKYALKQNFTFADKKLTLTKNFKAPELVVNEDGSYAPKSPSYASKAPGSLFQMMKQKMSPTHRDDKAQAKGDTSARAAKSTRADKYLFKIGDDKEAGINALIE